MDNGSSKKCNNCYVAKWQHLMLHLYSIMLEIMAGIRCQPLEIYMLFAGWEVRIAKNCDRGLENAARIHRPRAAFSWLRSQFFTIRTDPKPANNLFLFSLLLCIWLNKPTKIVLQNAFVFLGAHPMLSRSLSYGKSEE